MPTDLEIQQRILFTAHQQFMKFGISKVTMDELADELAMSKKTLYKFFPSKDAIIRALLNSVMEETRNQCNALVNEQNIDFVEKLKRVLSFLGKQYSTVTPQFMEDMRRNNPEVWREIQEWRKKSIFEDFGKLVDEGVQTGVFRSDVKKQMIVMMYAGTVEYLINPEMLSQLPFTAAEVFDAIIKVIYEGILSDGAREKYLSTNVAQN